jgi:hypothetical protein
MWGQFIYHPFIAAPLMFLALAFIPAKSKFNTVFNILIVGLYTFIIYKIVLWPDYGTYYLRYLYILLFFIVCIKPIRKFKDLPTFRKKYANRWLVRLSGVIKGLLMILLLLILSKNFINSITEEVQTIDLEFPLKEGTYYITNQHKDFREEYAYDITQLNIWGSQWSSRLYKPTDLEFYNIFKDTVYSPCCGNISEVVENHTDHSIGKLEDFKSPANKVVIQVGDKSVELLHLLKNSVLVNIGDTVIIGQAIALVGNSGMSRYPHLHINAYCNDGLLQYPSSIPIFFNGKLYDKNYLLKNNKTR